MSTVLMSFTRYTVFRTTLTDAVPIFPPCVAVIVADPLLSALTRPGVAPSTAAIAALSDCQVAVAVTSLVLWSV